MKKLIDEIEAYAAAVKLSPSTVIQRAAGLGGGKWKRWQAGGDCSIRVAERIRAYMAANPPSMDGKSGEAA